MHMSLIFCLNTPSLLQSTPRAALTPPHIAMTAPTLLSLPAEIRLQIWSCVFTQPPNAAFIRSPRTHELILHPHYSAPAQLSLRLTCCQICNEVGNILPFQRTTFVIRVMDPHTFTQRSTSLLDHQFGSIKKLALPIHWIISGHSVWPDDCWIIMRQWLSLSELALYFEEEKVHTNVFYGLEIVIAESVREHLEYLTNVKVVKVFRNGSSYNLRDWYRMMVGMMLKGDHYFRYDKKSNLANKNSKYLDLWWDWKFDVRDQTLELFARAPIPIMPEAEYIELVAPMVKSITDDVEAEEAEKAGTVSS
jgi:hypothetical protein